MSRKKTPELWGPAPYDAKVVHALQALNRGEAGEHEQKRALRWIIECAGTYDQQFHPESSRVTDFALGKRWVGLQIVKLLNLKPGVIAAAEQEDGNG